MNDMGITAGFRNIAPKELSFEQKQAVTFGFLKAFYTSDYVGYNVDRYSYSDVTQDIIDIVNTMGREIVTNVRIVQVANIFKTLAEGVGSLWEFAGALAQIVFSGDLYNFANLVQITKSQLIVEKNRIKANALANSVMLQILNREKTNIELKFMGF